MPEPLQPIDLPVGDLLLRPWRETDIEGIWAAFQDPELRRWNGGGVTSRTDALVLLGRRMDWTSGDHASWALVDPAVDDLLASVSLHSLDRLHGNVQIGYWTVPAARGRGLAPAAVDAACRWAFGALPVDRVELCHAVDNPASGRVAEKAGFTREGRLRRSYRYGDGVKHDELLWARLADDPAPEISTRS
ncbi:Protein N-acetyltransferase, RimJ/RimL family [Blastococcus sp. DSM 46786]|uniref:GNAT family N-acetyltransferase n=1 Tax=Blastococcus sp. DSM 46786 TaxID=1798227 RepID=UPI0008CF152A|nr:GNAT family N-acetyltransferase [Blastococcus sp. DSM 46786]SEL96334.1 Protein N-acetyltransferase, RimJ/RimL family [Blastococcus sp. DSM 46786]